MRTILIQIAEHAWTQAALHQACELARDTGDQIILLRLMQVEHISYLGSEFGEIPISRQEYAALEDYAATAEDYGLSLTVEQMQCVSPLDALADAVHLLGATTLFAYIHSSWVPFLHELRLHHLERRLRGTGCALFTLEETSAASGQPPLPMKPFAATRL